MRGPSRLILFGAFDDGRINSCGGCTACCVALPIADRDLLKDPGVPCPHLGRECCTIYQRRPDSCREYLCLWRQDPWLGKRPAYRPDQLGVLCHAGAEGLCLYELRPGALDSDPVRYIKSRLREKSGGLIKLYPYGSHDGLRVTPEHVGADVFAPGVAHRWEWVADDEAVLRRLPLQMA
jgi:hypothetical protein